MLMLLFFMLAFFFLIAIKISVLKCLTDKKLHFSVMKSLSGVISLPLTHVHTSICSTCTKIKNGVLWF